MRCGSAIAGREDWSRSVRAVIFHASSIETNVAAESDERKLFNCIAGMRFAEEKNIRTGAPDERSATRFEERDAKSIKGEAMNDDGAFVQCSRAMQIENFPSALQICAFGEMENEWLIWG